MIKKSIKNTKMENKIGKAYAFFDCDASSEQIERSLPDIRDFVETPSDLELKLTEGASGLQLDDKLRQLISAFFPPPNAGGSGKKTRKNKRVKKAKKHSIKKGRKSKKHNSKKHKKRNRKKSTTIRKK